MLHTFKPKSALLEKYIDFFYVFTSDKPEQLSYLGFPHTSTAISFFSDVEIERSNQVVNIVAAGHGTKNTAVEILGKYTQPILVNYSGHCDEVAIVFKPLGINHFFEDDLVKFSAHFSQPLSNPRWTAFSRILFREPDVPIQLENLEAFLLDNFMATEFQVLYTAISYLEDLESNYSVEKIAAICGFNLKTFQRNFHKHLTCSPSEYRRIARFRNSLKNKLVSDALKTLTKVSYESNYYDQSYFIREFKKLTQLNPKNFFDNITAIDKKNIVWKIN